MVEKGVRLKSACEKLRISRSGLYRDPARELKTSFLNEVLVEKLKELCLAHPFWGYRRMTAWLRHREGFQVNRKLVQRLMREKGPVVEQARHRALRSPQHEKPKATRPTLRARTSEWKEALVRALGEKFPWGVRGQGLSLISDNACQPTSVTFMRDIAELGIQQIFCSYDNPRGNAETERVMRTVKEECLWLNEFSCFEQAREAIGKWIRDDYNRLYVHSALGDLSPEEFYQQWVQRQQAALPGGA